jgi:hypothetical protein
MTHERLEHTMNPVARKKARASLLAQVLAVVSRRTPAFRPAQTDGWYYHFRLAGQPMCWGPCSYDALLLQARAVQSWTNVTDFRAMRPGTGPEQGFQCPPNGHRP